jgi:hypothetical protein
MEMHSCSVCDDGRLLIDNIKKENVSMRVLLRQGYKFIRGNFVLKCSFPYFFFQVRKTVVVMMVMMMILTTTTMMMSNVFVNNPF